MGCAVDELVRAVDPVEIKIEVAIEKPRKEVFDASAQSVEAQDSADDDVPL